MSRLSEVIDRYELQRLKCLEVDWDDFIEAAKPAYQEVIDWLMNQGRRDVAKKLASFWRPFEFIPNLMLGDDRPSAFERVAKEVHALASGRAQERPSAFVDYEGYEPQTLAPIQRAILKALEDAREPMTQEEISKRTGCSVWTVSRGLKAMRESYGWTRRPHGKRHGEEITPKGKAALKQYRLRGEEK